MIRWLRHTGCLIFLLTVLPLSSQVNGDADQIRKKHIKTIFLGSSDNTLAGLTLFYTREGRLYLERYVTLDNPYEPGDMSLIYFDVRGRDSSYMHVYLPDTSLARTTGPFNYVLEHQTYSYPSDSVTIVHDTLWNIMRQLTLIRHRHITERHTKTIVPRGRRPVCLPENIVTYRYERTSSMAFRYANKYSTTPLDTATHLEVIVLQTRMAKNKIVSSTSERRYSPDRTQAISTVESFTLNKRLDTIRYSRTAIDLEPFDSITPATTPPDFSYPCYAEDCSTLVKIIRTPKFLWWYTIRSAWTEKSQIYHWRFVTRYPQEHQAFTADRVYPWSERERKSWRTFREYVEICDATLTIYSYW